MLLTLSPPTAGGNLSLPDFVRLAFTSGFNGVEWSVEQAHLIAQSQGFPALAAIFENHRTLPAAFGLPVEWRKDEETFQQGMAQLPAQAKLAQDLDCSRCITWVLPDGGVPVKEYRETSVRRFAEIARVLNDQGVRLGLEFLGPKQFRADPDNVWFYDIPGALQAVDEVQSRSDTGNVGLLVDCWHWHASGGNTMDLASIPVEQVVHVHINDAPTSVERDNLIDNQRELPGATGVIDVSGFLRTLQGIGFDGPVAVETFSDALNAMPAEQAAQMANEAAHRVFAAASVEPLRLV